MDSKKAQPIWIITLVFFFILIMIGGISACAQSNSEKPLLHASPLPLNTEMTKTPTKDNNRVQIATKTPSKSGNSNQSLNPSSTPAATFLIVKSQKISLRAGPDFKHPELSNTYQRGTRMIALGRSNDWLYVESPNGEKGWINLAWIEIDPSLLAKLSTIVSVPTAPSQVVRKTKEPDAYPNP
jgi:SH3-like domain-containing protein